MADGNEGLLTPVLSLDVVRDALRPLEYFRDTLGLSCEGANPCDKEFELVVSRKDVEQVFGEGAAGGRGYLINSAVDEDGNPDEGMVQFAHLMLKKVYGEVKSKKRLVGLAFVRGLIADRRYSIPVDWARFAYESQFRPQRAAPTPRAEREKRRICFDEEDRECRSVEEHDGVERVGDSRSPRSELRQCFRMFLEDPQDPRMDMVYRKELERRDREESHEEQVRRAEIREWKVKRHWEDAQSSVQALERKMSLEKEELEDKLRQVDRKQERIEEVKKQLKEMRDKHEIFQRERQIREKKLQDMFQAKQLLLGSNPESKKDQNQIGQLQTDMEYEMEFLEAQAPQGDIQVKQAERFDRMKKKLEAELVKLEEEKEQLMRTRRESEKQLHYEQTREQRAAELLEVRSLICERYKEATNLSVVPRSIPQATDYPEDLRPPETIEIKPCPVCERWFHCLDFVGASCGCLYHFHCAYIWFRGPERHCCRPTCRKRMHPDWLTAWGKDWDAEDEKMDKELGQDKRRARWKQDSLRSTKRTCNRPEDGQANDETMANDHKEKSSNGTPLG